MIRALFLILMSFALSSCGFHPVHSTGNRSTVPPIDITSINSVDGAEFYRALSDLVENSENARYQLTVKNSYTSTPLAIAKTSDVVEQGASQAISYRLLDKETGAVTSGSFSLSGSYSSAYSAYTTYTEDKQERINLARLCAGEMHRRLIIYFMQKKGQL